MTQKRRKPAPPQNRPLLNTIDAVNYTAVVDPYDIEQRVTDQVDWSIWRAVFDGHFKLAVKCDVCGRWLTANASKKARRGSRCSARAGGAL